MKLTIYVQMDTENIYSNTIIYTIFTQKTMKRDININIIMFEKLEKVAERPYEKECIQNAFNVQSIYPKF